VRFRSDDHARLCIDMTYRFDLEEPIELLSFIVPAATAAQVSGDIDRLGQAQVTVRDDAQDFQLALRVDPPRVAFRLSGRPAYSRTGPLSVSMNDYEDVYWSPPEPPGGSEVN
jgi:hypothetical protein